MREPEQNIWFALLGAIGLALAWAFILWVMRVR